ncbi:hypothetical protein AB1Y20_004685 [Prymnesium parvum]|uniref:Protein ENHANCED DISEASE RESISTANCE 2 C-terminal domain-containing protein n=1 Tax=Prymnesium parvum TaxID=97485 RepID=A0AB34IZH1_PRYPA
MTLAAKQSGTPPRRKQSGLKMRGGHKGKFPHPEAEGLPSSPSSPLVAPPPPPPGRAVALLPLAAVAALACALIAWLVARRRSRRARSGLAYERVSAATHEEAALPAALPSAAPRAVAVAAEEEEEAELEAAEAHAPLESAPPPPPPPELGRLELRRGGGGGGGEEKHCWLPLGEAEFMVRGQTYLHDGKKVSAPCSSELLGVELFSAAAPALNVAGRLDSPIPQLLARASAPLNRQLLVINLMIPAVDGVYQLVLYFGTFFQPRPGPAARLLERFIAGTDAFRSARLKMIPSVADGPWMVRKAVPSRPAILGKTLRQRYFFTDDYFECDIDCNSNPAAGRIVSLVKSCAKDITIDLAFLIEAQTVDELPERLLGTVRIAKVDLDSSSIPQLEQ